MTTFDAKTCSSETFCTAATAAGPGRSGQDSRDPKAHPNSTHGANSRCGRNGDAGSGVHAETTGETVAFTGCSPFATDQAAMPTDPGDHRCVATAREPVNAVTFPSAKDRAGHSGTEASPFGHGCSAGVFKEAR